MHEQNEKFNREIETVKKKQTRNRKTGGAQGNFLGQENYSVRHFMMHTCHYIHLSKRRECTKQRALM